MFIATNWKCITCVDPNVIFLLQSTNTSQFPVINDKFHTLWNYTRCSTNISRTQFSVHISITLTTVRTNILQQSSVNLCVIYTFWPAVFTETSLYIFVFLYVLYTLPSVLSSCWLGGRKGHPACKKLEWWGTGMVIWPSMLITHEHRRLAVAKCSKSRM